MPSVVPSTKTPSVDNGDVRAIARVGSTTVIGGNFTSVAGAARSRLAAFNPATGALTSFTLPVNGEVSSIIPGPNDHTAYIGGAFTQVGTTAAQFVALVDLNTSAVVPGFTPPAFNFGEVNDLDKRGNRLYLAGSFSRVGGKAHGGLASLNATTGALDPFMNVQVAGHHNDTGSGAQGYVGPWAFDVTPDGSQMVATGNFKTVDGLLRDQLVTIDLTGSTAVVRPDWATGRYAPYCFNWAFDGYTRGVSYSPDGSYFVVNSTGGGVAGTLCDATARFETNGSGSDVQPTWVNEAGGDTMWGVTITDSAVFVGGHARWNNNPTGSDYAGPGAVPRPGLAALDPVSGRPLAWNPGRNPAGKAVYSMLATSDGLYVGSDTDWVGDRKYKRPKLSFFPYQGGVQLAATTTGSLPGTVFLGGSQSTGTSNVLYRVNAGGTSIQSADSGPDWADDSGSSNPNRNDGSNAAGYAPGATVDGTVPATTPAAVFDSERWSPSDNPALKWAFPVANGAPVQVRLYFANRCTCTSAVGSRRFNVDVEGSRVLSSYDIVASVGDQKGTMRSFDVTSDGTINIDFSHVTENPLINAIEIVRTDVPTPPPADVDGLAKVGFTGTSTTAAQAVPNGGVAWGQVRGAFMVGSKVFYGLSDSYLYSRTFDGSTWGPAVQVNAYHDPIWKDVSNNLGGTYDGNNPTLYNQIPNVTGMFYSGGRLYYTLFGDSTLRSRWFSPDSGIVDEAVRNAPSSVNFSGAGGMFVAGGNLYYVVKADRSLYRVAFAAGVVSGSPTMVSGPSIDGVDWRNRGLFLYNGAALNQAPTAAFSQTCTFQACSFNGSASADSDGSIASYAWDFGDGTSGSGATPDHTYVSAGAHTVTLTVTDNKGATGQTSHSVTTTAPPANQPPTAAFSSVCAAASCNFDGSGSSDSDGTIASYSWDFGDSSTGTGATPTHGYATTGTYTVTLRVVDNSGAEDTVSHQVSVTVPASPVSFVGASHSAPGATKVKSAAVPAGTAVGDTMLLYFTRGTTATWTGPAGITGWTAVSTLTNSTITATVYSKTVTSGDLGGTVRFDNTAFQKAVASLAVYRGVNSSTITVTSAGDSATASHVAPAVSAAAGDWVVTYWGEKSSGTTAWTAPSSETARDTAVLGTDGAGRYSGLLADSGGPVASGTYAARTATTDVASEKAIMWSLALHPAG